MSVKTKGGGSARRRSIATQSPRSVARLETAAESLEALGKVAGTDTDFRWAPIDVYRALEGHTSSTVESLRASRIKGAAQTVEALNSAWDDRHLSWSVADIRREAARLRGSDEADRLVREADAAKLAAFEALRSKARQDLGN